MLDLELDRDFQQLLAEADDESLGDDELNWIE
jgi:hypothetical protein